MRELHGLVETLKEREGELAACAEQMEQAVSEAKGERGRCGFVCVCGSSICVLRLSGEYVCDVPRVADVLRQRRPRKLHHLLVPPGCLEPGVEIEKLKPLKRCRTSGVAKLSRHFLRTA